MFDREKTIQIDANIVITEEKYLKTWLFFFILTRKKFKNEFHSFKKINFKS